MERHECRGELGIYLELKALEIGNGVGPNLLIDGGAEIAMIIKEGAYWKKIWEEERRLPESSRYDTEMIRLCLN